MDVYYNDKDYYPMDWEYTNKNIQTTLNDKNRILNRIVPRHCFSQNNFGIQINIKRDKYFVEMNKSWGLTKENIIDNINRERYSKPYCRICHKGEFNELVLDHWHDLNKPGKYNLHEYPGYFRAFICKSCNSIESHAKKITNIDDRKNYWCEKKEWTFVNRDFFLDNLKNLGYLN